MQNIVHYILHYPRAEQESIYGLNFVCEAWTEVSLAIQVESCQHIQPLAMSFPAVPVANT